MAYFTGFSDDGSQVTPGDPSQYYGGASLDQNQVAAQTAIAGGAQAPSQTIGASFAPGGQYGAGSGTGAMANALQPTYAPAPPNAAVATNDPAQQLQQILAAYQPQNAQASTIDPSSQIQQILAGFAPVQKQATSNLNDALAAAGVSGGGAIGAQQQLQGQLSSSIAPTLASAIEGANGANASAQTGVSEYNAGVGNSFGQFLGNSIEGANAANQSAINAGNQYNTSNQINTETGNVSNANSFAQLIAQLQQQQYLANQGNYTGLLQSGLSGQQGINQASTGNYTTTGGIGSAVGGLGSQIGNLYGRSTPTPAAPAAASAPTYSTSAGSGTTATYGAAQ